MEQNLFHSNSRFKIIHQFISDTFLNNLKSYLTDTEQKMIKLDSYPKMLLLSDWFYPAYRNKPEIVHYNTIKFVSQSKPLSEANLNASRVWIGSRGEHFALEPLKITFDKYVASLLDEISSYHYPSRGDDHIKVGYLIEQHNTSVEVEFDTTLHEPRNLFDDQVWFIPYE